MSLYNSMSIGEPNPRFAEYKEEFDTEGNLIGFTLEGNPFVFKFDGKGGWRDEQGNYYNSEGIELEKLEDWGAEDEENIVDQIEEELRHLEGEEDAEGEGDVVHEEEEEKEEQVQFKSIDEEIGYVLKLLEGVKNLKIFIRSRKSVESKSADKKIEGTDRKQMNISISKAVEEINKSQLAVFQSKLPEGAQIEFSSDNQMRYWFGYVSVNQGEFQTVLNTFKTNDYFGVLKKKTLLHLYTHVNQKASQQERTQLENKLNQFDKENQVLVTLSNIPEESPLSLVVDLIEEVNVPITEIYQIVMNTETSAAKIWTNTKSALSLVRLHGVNFEGNTASITVESTGQKLIPNVSVFIVSSKNINKFSVNQILENQLYIENSKTEGYLKVDPPDVYLVPKVLKRLLMHRADNPILNPIALKAFVIKP